MGKHMGDLVRGFVKSDMLLQSVYKALSASESVCDAYVMSPDEAMSLSATTDIQDGGYYEKLFPSVSPNDLVPNISSDSIWGICRNEFLYGISGLYDEQLRRDGAGKTDTDKDLFFYPISFNDGIPVFKVVYRLQHHHPNKIVKTEPTSGYVDLSAYYGKIVNLKSQSTQLSAQFERIANHIESGLKRVGSKI